MRPTVHPQFALLVFVGVSVGVLIMSTSREIARLQGAIGTGQTETVVAEVAELTQVNQRLRSQVAALDAELEQLTVAAQDIRQANEALSQSILRFELLLGLRAGSGEGVTIAPRQPLDITQLLDLVNALRSVGVDAIEVNGERVTARTAFSGSQFHLPLTMTAIGDQELLRSTLIRNGGILEQLGIEAEVTASQHLSVSARPST